MSKQDRLDDAVHAKRKLDVVLTRLRDAVVAAECDGVFQKDMRDLREKIDGVIQDTHLLNRKAAVFIKELTY